MVDVQWAREVSEFKAAFRYELLKKFSEYLSAVEKEHDNQFWNDEYGFDVEVAFEDFLCYLETEELP